MAPSLVLLPWLAACGSAGGAPEPLYAAYCARCHAADGRGDARLLPLYPRVDLTRSALVRSGARGAIYSRIAEGVGSMPGFAHRLEHREIESLVDFILRKWQPKGGR